MKVTFFCVQPIVLSEEVYLEMINYTIKKDIESSKLPSWMNQLKKISNIAYANTIAIEIDKANTDFLEKDIESRISEYIRLSKSTAYLLFDYKLLSFTMCTEIKMDLSDFSKEELDYCLSTKGLNNNFYFKTRNLMIEEDFENKISEWSKENIENSFKGIKKTLKEIYDYDLKSELLKIKEKEGSITVFINLNKDKYKDKKVIDKFMNLNYEADRLDIENPMPISLGEYTKYYFGGRIHTVTYTDKKNLINYFTIQYQMQRSLCYTAVIKKLYQRINKEINDKKKNLIYREKNKLIKYFINKIGIFELENDSFKMAIKNNNEEIYKKIEKKWNIEETIESLTLYIKNFENMLKEDHKSLVKFEKESEKIKEKELLEKIDVLNKERRYLEEKGEKDPLTRAYNREKFEKDLNTENKDKLYLAFIDGDDFKKINDTYGHQTGDKVLKNIVTIMFQVLNENEIDGSVYRFGGEEFIITIYNEKNASVLGILNLIKEEIEYSKVEYKNNKVRCTVSIGAVRAQKEQGLEEIIEVADQLVYRAKEKGKNRIEYIF